MESRQMALVAITTYKAGPDLFSCNSKVHENTPAGHIENVLLANVSAERTMGASFSRNMISAAVFTPQLFHNVGKGVLYHLSSYRPRFLFLRAS
jgi:hypothetical protein